jgi:hypothetical protein
MPSIVHRLGRGWFLLTNALLSGDLRARSSVTDGHRFVLLVADALTSR